MKRDETQARAELSENELISDLNVAREADSQMYRGTCSCQEGFVGGHRAH